MCVWCPRWPVQRLRSAQPPLKDRPLILFTEFRRSLSVTAYSVEASVLGVRTGMPLGEARALSIPSSRERQNATSKPVFKWADPAADRTRLVELALHCQRYSPLTGLEEGPQPESIWLDISGSEVLFGGERGLVEAIRTDLASQGIQARMAIADTWGAAWAASHFAEQVVSLVPTGEQVQALASLPVMALRLPEAVIEPLKSLDLWTVGRLMQVPRASLPSRFGKELGRRLDQALGLAPELLTAERLAEPIRAEWVFEEPIADHQTLEHVCRTLLERILATIESRRAALRELTCHWIGTNVDPVSLRMLWPTNDRRHLLELLRLHGERSPFTCAVHGVRMEVVEMGFPTLRQGLLFEDSVDETSQRSLRELVDRLSSRLGCQAVLRPHLQPDPLPEFSCQCIPWLSDSPTEDSSYAVRSRMRCRPLRLLRVPESLRTDPCKPDGMPSRVERSAIVRIRGPERIESGWWRGLDSKRDYYRLDLANGTSLWAFRDLSNNHWFLHGLFC